MWKLKDAGSALDSWLQYSLESEHRLARCLTFSEGIPIVLAATMWPAGWGNLPQPQLMI